MSKFEVTIAQTKVLTVEVEGKDADNAVQNAKLLVLDSNFDGRVGAQIVAGVRELPEKE